MNLFVDTSVWSLALRRDAKPDIPEVRALIGSLEAGDVVATTGLVLQELLQGFGSPKAREQILAHFAVLPFISPDRADHIAAAELRNRCRRAGIQAGTIDVLLAQLCIRHRLTLLATDRDFTGIAHQAPLVVWKA